MKPQDNVFMAQMFPLKEWELTPYNINHKLVDYYNLCSNLQHQWKPLKKQQMRERYDYLVYLNKQIRGRCFKKYADCPVKTPQQMDLFEDVA